MKYFLNKFNRQPKGMAMIIVLTVAFVVLITIGVGATIIANNLNKSGGQSAKGRAEISIAVALERLRGMYKTNASLLAGCAENDCIKYSDGTCVSCSDASAIYESGDIKYKIQITGLTVPDYNKLIVGNANLLVTGYYKDISKQKTTSVCLNYCAGTNNYTCGDNGCGGTCGTCVEPSTCGGDGDPHQCSGQVATSCSDITIECGDECSVGATCGGGVVVDADNNIVATPAGCDGSSCGSETDTVYYQWDKNSLFVDTRANDADNGENNMQYLTDASYQAALFCADSSYYGFDDWYLPAKNELTAMYNSGQITGYYGDYYWSSTQGSGKPSSEADTILFSNGEILNQGKDRAFYIRCSRRYGAQGASSCSDVTAECTESCVEGDRCGGGTLIDKGNFMVASLSGCDTKNCQEIEDFTTKAWDNEMIHGFTNAQDVTDGRNNMPYLSSSIYEAADFCGKFVFSGFSGWYLPSTGEFSTIANARNNNWTTGYVSGGFYWSSTEDQNESASAYACDNTDCQGGHKEDNSKYVRCLRRWQ